MLMMNNTDRLFHTMTLSITLKTKRMKIFFKSTCVVALEVLINGSHHNYKWYCYNMKVEWETGETTNKTLSIIASDDSSTCDIYADKNSTLELDEWKLFWSVARHQKKLLCLIKQAKLSSYRTSPRYKYGYQYFLNYGEAMELDRRHGITRWSDATNTYIG